VAYGTTQGADWWTSSPVLSHMTGTTNTYSQKRAVLSARPSPYSAVKEGELKEGELSGRPNDQQSSSAYRWGPPQTAQASFLAYGF